MRYALVTGASSGIGRAIAVALAQDGYFVFLVARNEARLQETLEAVGGEQHGAIMITDVTDPCSIQRLGAQVHARTKRLDILVNAAGMFMWDNNPNGDGKEAVIARLELVNFISKVMMCHMFSLALYNTGGGGVIVNVSSQAANFADDDPRMENEHGYVFSMRQVSKWHKGLLTHSIAYYGGKVKLVLLEPGLIDTPLARANFTAETIGEDPDWSQVPTPEQFVQDEVMPAITKARA